MAIVRRTLEQMMQKPGRVDWAKVDATTEEDISRHRIEDGEGPAAPERAPSEPAILAQAVRLKLDLSQPQFAALLGVPVATLRNWEQGRVWPDPAAMTLLLLVHDDPALLTERLRRLHKGSRELA